MEITHYEKVNRQKLNEVLECDDISFEEGDDLRWKTKFLKELKMYAKKREFKNGIQVTYKQANKYGRFNVSIGLQTFQRDIRKYICDD
jgi:hypothetical protein